MKIDLKRLIAPLAAFLLLAITLQQTSEAMRRSSPWGGKDAPGQSGRISPFARLDAELARRADVDAAVPARNPFDFYRARTAQAARTERPRRRTPAPAPKPVLTAIIFDNDPRALVRFNGRDYTVQDNSLFADYRVVRITRDEVVLDKSGESLVLRRPTGGS